MKNFLLLISIILFFPTELIHAATSKQKMHAKQESSCAKISLSLQNSRSVKQLQQTLKKTGKRKLNSCKSKFKKDKRLTAALKQLSKKAEVQKEKNIAIHKKLILAKAKPSKQLKKNQRIDRLRNIGRNKIRALNAHSRAAIPSKRPVQHNQVARINGIIPDTVAPGLNVAIDGLGFGTQQGSAQLKIGGVSFDARIDAWHDNWISAYFPESITHVAETRNAIIIVRTPTGKTLNFTTSFIPIYEQQVIKDTLWERQPFGFVWDFDGDSGESYVFADSTLGENWVVAEYSWYEKDWGNCTKRNPFMSKGNNRLKSKIKWFYDFWEGAAGCGLDVVIEGPKGFPSGF